MSSWAKPGVKCVWVNVEKKPGYVHNPRPPAGTIVTISDIMEVEGDTTLVIVGWPNPNEAKGLVEQGWNITRFRPLVPKKTEAEDVALFTHHLEMGEPVVVGGVSYRSLGRV